VTRRALLVAAAALALAISGCGAGRSANGPQSSTAGAPASGAVHATPVAAGAVAADFALRDQDGRMVQLSAQRGRIVILTFLYTHCPDVCPLIATAADRAVRSLGSRSRDVVILAVSVDPRGDTPAAVRRFISERRLSPAFHYLVGPASELRPIWQSYNLLVEAPTPERIAHSAYVLVIGRGGRPLSSYPPTVSTGRLAADLARLVHRPA
jgi:protein SCO1